MPSKLTGSSRLGLMAGRGWRQCWRMVETATAQEGGWRQQWHCTGGRVEPAMALHRREGGTSDSIGGGGRGKEACCCRVQSLSC
eukprot:1157843-Pelagomonas_calceolata.AAC.12